MEKANRAITLRFRCSRSRLKKFFLSLWTGEIGLKRSRHQVIRII